ncbi:calpain-like protease PalBory [Aspergillus mulundensis]|uniref:Calpain-like protease palB n=1 Tax=Aspergillus mulundensis TaxID=1810919 RepID=A0A3D8RA98_9EURO|nr:Calpain-like protease palB [Aspergillus mulundensis]RDW70838.1 Calpain-like protease palB [Aspergillus mulundensis]
MSRSSSAPSLKSLLSRAQKAEQDVSVASSQQQALDAAIDVAEHYMSALAVTTSSTDKTLLDAKFKEWLTRAEQIKGAEDWRAAARTRRSGLWTPASTRKLTNREEILLLEASKLNGFKFPPWAKEPSNEEFNIGTDGDELFTDKPDLHLSSLQRGIFAGWKRPHELLSGQLDDEGTRLTPVMSVSGNTDLVQDVLTDCSVVASLCATTSRSERGLGDYLLPIVYPCQYESMKPGISPSGKYIFRFYFNGCFRKVIVDDRLPSSKTSRSLYMIDRNHDNFLWPALVEKAYLKLRGGYEFPGSNSGTDLWVLTGWIPEQVFLHNDDVTADQIWSRLVKSFHSGDVLLTIGTGKLTEKGQKELGLVSEHDYAILDMKEFRGRRQILIKNPWAGTDTVYPALFADPEPFPNSPLLSPGTFWMDCGKVLQNFENLYLNWNPGRFTYQEDVHFTWDLSTGKGMAGCFVKNPQFSVSAERGGEVWLLLGRHFRTVESRTSEEDHGFGFISIYVFKGGKRVSLSDGALHRGPYVDSPNTLMRLNIPPKTPYTVVVSEESLPAISQNFTLSAFSKSPMKISPAPNNYKCVTKIQGSWTPTTAGGNAESARYSLNPQFNISLIDPTDISIVLEPSDPELATHVKLFWSDGKRIARVRKRDIVADSGDYRRGGSLAEKKDMDVGKYTIVVSTFAPDQLGPFTLWVSTNIPCEVMQLPSEAAGRRTVLSDIGILLPGQDRMLAHLQTSRLTRVKLIARSRESRIGNRPVGPSPVLMSVELGQGPYKEILATSEDGEHSDSISGVRVGDFDLQPGMEGRGGVWIVLERIGGPGGQVEDHFEVEALGEEKVEIGEWIVEDA